MRKEREGWEYQGGEANLNPNIFVRCRFLALDPAAEYITGHCFNVDGGIAIGC